MMKFLQMALLTLLGTVFSISSMADEKAGNPRGYEIDILADVFAYSASDLAVPIELVFQGCPARDCIPAIDQPEFVPVGEVDYLSDDDLLLIVDFAGDVRAYPSRILDVHEIVNDQFGSTPVVVSYCPLCGSGLAFIRQLNGEDVEFGVSGLLHNNDLIMYDRLTDSLWQQITGEAIAGPEKGARLQSIPLTMSTWSEWETANPDGVVLGLPGPPEKYSKLHYAAYGESDGLMFPVSASDARLSPKRIIFGAEVAGVPVAVDEHWLTEQGSWSSSIEGVDLEIKVMPSGGITGQANGEQISVHRMFWFAWYSFHPKTLLIDGKAH